MLDTITDYRTDLKARTLKMGYSDRDQLIFTRKMPYMPVILSKTQRKGGKQ